jgi:hypothetical protein
MEKIGIVLPEITQYPKIWAIHPGDIHKGKILIASFLYLP